MRMALPIIVLAMLGAGAGAQSPPQRIPPPDSEAYCQALRVRIAQASTSAETVALLAAEGEALCAAGQSRRGIAKLRRALRIALTDG